MQKAKAGSGKLDRAEYLKLEQPSEREPARLIGSTEPNLFHAIVNRCVAPNTVCMDKMMATDLNVKPGQQKAE